MIAWRPALGAPDAEPVAGLPPFAVGDERPRWVRIAEWPALLVVAVLIAVSVRALVAQAFYIPSISMAPQLQVNDRIVVSKLSYRLHEPRRGDIVVFDCPPLAQCAQRPPPSNPVGRAVGAVLEGVGLRQPSTDEYIKRVVGLPGEVVEGRGGDVYVDGRRLVEPYLPKGSATSTFPPTLVPEGALWVMGDNRSNSTDSRIFGAVRTDTVVGRAVMRVWPPSTAAFL